MQPSVLIFTWVPVYQGNVNNIINSVTYFDCTDVYSLYLESVFSADTS